MVDIMDEKKDLMNYVINRIAKRKRKFEHFSAPRPKELELDTNCNGWTKYE